MACVFNVPYASKIDDLLAKGLRESKNFDGQFEGTAQNGFFSFRALGGTFTGTYKVGETTIEIIIQDKPFLIPCGVIETFIRAHIK
jgi:hypothetical protein